MKYEIPLFDLENVPFRLEPIFGFNNLYEFNYIYFSGYLKLQQFKYTKDKFLLLIKNCTKICEEMYVI